MEIIYSVFISIFLVLLLIILRLQVHFSHAWREMAYFRSA